MREDQGNFFVLKTTSWKNEGLILSWDSKKVDEQRILVKMDKIYTFKWRFVSEV